MQVSTDANNQLLTKNSNNVFDDTDKETDMGLMDDPVTRSRRLSVYQTASSATGSALPNKQKDDKDGTSSSSFSNTPTKLVRKGMLEVTFAVDQDKGVKVEPNARMAMQSTFPLLAQKQWSGHLQAQAVVRGYTGYTRQEAAVKYAVDRKTSIATGMTAVRNRYHVYVDAQTHLGSHRQHTVSARYSQLPTTSMLRGGQASLTGKSTYSYGILSSTCNVPLVVSPQPMTVSVAWQSKTIHPWRFSLGWNQIHNFSWQWSLSPKLSNFQTLRLAIGQIRQGVWAWSGNFGQQLRQGKSFHVALSYNASQGLLWILSWSNGDFSLNVPISFLEFQDMWAAVALAGLTKVVQDAVAVVLRLDQVAVESTAQQQRQIMEKQQTARSEALGQQSLMDRQAKTRMRTERENQGLVIQSATYFLSSTDHDDRTSNNENSFDVTTPLQFWVNDATLELPAGSKKNLLGFFDILAHHQVKDPSKERDLQVVDSIWTRKWWTNFIRLPKRTAQTKVAKPMLKVVYEFKGRRDQIVIHDEEKLELPR
eukprot:scaffold1223_cov151-Amphora_coffeaeformis.AAC.2